MWSFDADQYMKKVLSPAEVEFRSNRMLPDPFTRYWLPIDVSDEAIIRAAFQKVEDFWNKTKKNAKYTKLLEVLLEEKALGLLHAQLLDKSARQNLRQLAEKEQNDRREKKFKALVSTLDVVASKGYITPQEKAHLITRYKSEGLTEAEILTRISAVRVTEETIVNLPSEGLPERIRKQISSNLAALGCQDLYTFLGVARGSPKSEWSVKHADAKIQWRQKPNNSLLTAANELLELIRMHIIEGDPKAYEDAVLWELLEQLRLEVKVAAAGDGQIDRAEFTALVAFARKNGIDESKAKDYIVALARQIGASVEWSSTEDSVGCPNCFTAVSTKTHAEKCPVCDHPLWTECPRCKARLPLKIATCGKCDFALAELPRVRLLVRTGELALDAGRVADAAKAAEEAEEIWGRQGDVEVLLQRIKERLTRLETLRDEIDRCLAEKRIYGAKKAVSSLVLDSPDHRFRDGKTGRDIAARIDTSLKNVDILLEKGQHCQSSRQLNDAVIAYEAALSIAKDCEAAQDALGKCPPEQPSKVKLSLDDGGAIIDWVPGRCVGELRYVVVRQEGHAPASPGDGVRLCDTTDCRTAMMGCALGS